MFARYERTTSCHTQNSKKNQSDLKFGLSFPVLKIDFRSNRIGVFVCVLTAQFIEQWRRSRAQYIMPVSNSINNLGASNAFTILFERKTNYACDGLRAFPHRRIKGRHHLSEPAMCSFRLIMCAKRLSNSTPGKGARTPYHTPTHPILSISAGSHACMLKCLQWHSEFGNTTEHVSETMAPYPSLGSDRSKRTPNIVRLDAIFGVQI